MEYINYIPLTSIKKIEIYINSSSLSLAQIVKNTGCDYAITGTYYNTKWKATCHLKKDNVIYATCSDGYWGAAWDKGSDIVLTHVPDISEKYKNHYACCALIKDGKPLTPYYNSDVGGYRGRTAIGVSGNNLVIYASKDGTNDTKKPEGLRDYILAKDKNIKWMIMGDGGSKVNYYGKGTIMQGSAKSQNLILVYLNNNNFVTDTPAQTSNNVTNNVTNTVIKEDEKVIEGTFPITQTFMTKNPRYINQTKVSQYGYMQHSTAMPGTLAKDIIANWNSSSAQAEVQFIIDKTGIYQIMPLGIKVWHCGGAGNNTHVGCEICEPEQARFIDIEWASLSYGSKNNTTYAVKALQTELKAWGYDPNGIDGVFGNGTKTALLNFQKANGLTADGIAGKATLHALQKRKGCVMVYDAKANQEYFEKVYNQAVYVCAYVLKQLGTTTITTKNVLDHIEGNKAGIASDHADIAHWFVYHGKTMDNFREDVKTYILTNKLPYGSTSSTPIITETITPKNEMEEAWDKCCDAGIFDGSDPDSPCTRRQLATILCRLGLTK